MTSTLEQQIARQAREADRQRADASRTLRNAAARAARAGMSQRRIAELLGRSQPEVRRLLHASACKDASGAVRTWMTARSAADAVRSELKAGDETMALRMVIQALDHLKSLKDPEDVAEWEVEPAPLPDQRWDTLLRALTRHTTKERGLPTPDWAEDVEPLPQEWVFTRLASRRERVKRSTPNDLARLNVYLSANDLVTA